MVSPESFFSLPWVTHLKESGGFVGAASSPRLTGAIRAIIGRSNISDIYHWSDAGVVSWYDLAVAIQEEGRKRSLLAARFRSIPSGPISFSHRQSGCPSACRIAWPYGMN